MRSRVLSTLLVLALGAGLVVLPSGGVGAIGPENTHYVEMADGVKMAVSVNFPDGYDPQKPRFNPNVDSEGDPGSGWPTLFQMDGYGGGGDTVPTSLYGERYVTVYASIRGTGCSGGHFDLFDRVHAEDGKTIIDSWIPIREWFNGDVGIVGHSYPGLTGWMVASTRPAELDVVGLSGLIDDLYRGIVYPGGVPNYGFPATWTAVFRPALEQYGNHDRYVDELAAGDPTCTANIATRNADPFNTPMRLFDNPFVQGLTSQEDDTWWQMRSTISYVDRIDVPAHLTQQYQDEQTGPRGAHTLFERLDVPKRLVLTNGVHSTKEVGNADRLRWLDCWTYGGGDPLSEWCEYTERGATRNMLDTSERVRIHFETLRGEDDPIANEPFVSSDWPLPETEWTRYFLHSDGTLHTAPQMTPDADGGTSSYVSTTTGRQLTGENGLFGNLGDEGTGKVTFTDGPDMLTWEVEFTEDTAIAGPILLSLTASSTATDTDFFVDVLDVDTATGAISYLQRGMQRATHRQVDPLRSDYVASGPEAGSLYRAHHPHTNTTLNVLTPGKAERFEIEIFPLSHLFRPGHKLVITLHAPPLDDPLSTYTWYSGRPPAVNTVFQGTTDGLEPSSILLPLLTGAVPKWKTAPGCGALAGIPCFIQVSAP